VEIVVTDAARFRPYRCGVELLAALRAVSSGLRLARRAYGFVSDRPAIDLLTGGVECREALESGRGLEVWIASWTRDEAAFREERREILLYH
jgi:uncharacterized protein YbbC (DUF1343 family)